MITGYSGALSARWPHVLEASLTAQGIGASGVTGMKFKVQGR